MKNLGKLKIKNVKPKLNNIINKILKGIKIKKVILFYSENIIINKNKTTVIVIKGGKKATISS